MFKIGLSNFRRTQCTSLLLCIALMIQACGCDCEDDGNLLERGAEYQKIHNQQTMSFMDKFQRSSPLWKISKNGQTVGLFNKVEDAKKQFDGSEGQVLAFADQIQIPIHRAMELVAADRAKPFEKVAPDPNVAAVAIAVATEPPPPFEVNAELASKGAGLYASKTCVACHSTDGSKRVGPTFKGLWGRKEVMSDGVELYVDRDYYVRSIREPNAQVVKGYPPAMAMIEITDDEIEAILHYIASL